MAMRTVSSHRWDDYLPWISSEVTRSRHRHRQERNELFVTRLQLIEPIITGCADLVGETPLVLRLHLVLMFRPQPEVPVQQVEYATGVRQF